MPKLSPVGGPFARDARPTSPMEAMLQLASKHPRAGKDELRLFKQEVKANPELTAKRRASSRIGSLAASRRPRALGPVAPLASGSVISDVICHLRCARIEARDARHSRSGVMSSRKPLERVRRGDQEWCAEVTAYALHFLSPLG
jgi:hypothetical protein